MTAPAERIIFTPYSSGSSTVSSVNMTVPAGTVATDVIVLAFNVTTGTTPNGSISSGMIQRYAAFEGTSAYLFVYTGTGFTAGQTITFSLAIAARTIAVGAVYSGATYEGVGSGGASSTTVATAPSMNTAAANDMAVGVVAGVASSSSRTFSSITSGWANRTSQYGGSGTRYAMLLLADQVQAAAGATPALVGTASGSMLSSTGVQIALAGSSGGGGGSGTIRTVNVGGVATTATPKVNVGGVATTVTRRTNVGGSPV